MNRSVRALVASVGLVCIASGAWAQAEKPGSAPAQPEAKQPDHKDKDKKKGEKKDAAKSLKVGDPAPELKVDHWVKGESVAGLEPGKAYVVEFWATWCGPCVKQIPHLTALQKAHPDVTFIGVAGFERMKGNNDNRLDKLTDFVKKQGDDMGYRVAFEGNGELGKTWMDAAGQNGIPCAFVIDTAGKVTWIGYPGDEKDFEKAVAAVSTTKPDDKKDEKKEKKEKGAAAAGG